MGELNHLVSLDRYDHLPRNIILIWYQLYLQQSIHRDLLRPTLSTGVLRYHDKLLHINSSETRAPWLHPYTWNQRNAEIDCIYICADWYTPTPIRVRFNGSGAQLKAAPIIGWLPAIRTEPISERVYSSYRNFSMDLGALKRVPKYQMGKVYMWTTMTTMRASNAKNCFYIYCFLRYLIQGCTPEGRYYRTGLGGLGIGRRRN